MTPEPGRLSQPPAPELIDSAYRWEVGLAPHLWQGMGLSDLAHHIMLLEAGILPPDPGARLLRLLLDLNATPHEAAGLSPEHGDVYTNRERWLGARDAAAAGWLSAGRARREATTVAYHLAVRRGLLDVSEALAGFLHALTDRSEQHLNTVLPDFTYLQHAQPTTLAHYLLGFAFPALRDLDRLRAAFDRVNLSPAGGGSTNGSRLPLDRERLAALLGFDGVLPHPRDAMWQADGPIEVTGALVALLVNLDRLAEDLQIWSTDEFALIELGDQHARTSIIMPQKKNPYALAYVRGAAGQAIGKLTAMAVTGRTPSGQVDNRIFAYGEVPAVLELTARVARLMAGVMAAMTMRPERMAEIAAQGFTMGTDLAEALMLEHGLDFRTAHQVVGQAVRVAVDGAAATLTPAHRAAATQEVLGRSVTVRDALLREEMTPRALVAARHGLGGAA
ncbi:MAG: argininosuccinate lyase, partial [Chloroflexota bacterium]